jgi:hypothetical protein
MKNLFTTFAGDDTEEEFIEILNGVMKDPMVIRHMFKSIAIKRDISNLWAFDPESFLPNSDKHFDLIMESILAGFVLGYMAYSNKHAGDKDK